MNKPKITDRTKLYVGLFKICGTDSFTLGVTFNNSDRVFNTDIQWPWLRYTDTIRYEDIVFEPIDCPLTLPKLADLIRKTKVVDYTHLAVTDCNFIWAQHTPEGLYTTDNRFLSKDDVEWYADWREALPVLKKRLTTKLQDIRQAGKSRRLDYAAFVKAQAEIDKAQAIAVRTNNRYFKGIPF